MATQMEALDPSNLPVTCDLKSETLTLPGGLTSVAGITVITGGSELSCKSCMLAFCFWKTFIGFSCVAVGLWDQKTNYTEGTSHLLGLGLVILAFCFTVVGSIMAYKLLTRRGRQMRREQREDGKEVLVESERVIKKVTV